MTLSRFYSNFEAYDLLFKNLFNQDSLFAPVTTTKITHPVDIWENTETGLHIEVAGTGLTKSDIKIEIEGDVLKISYLKPQDEEEPNTQKIYNGISRRSFQLAYKIASKFNIGNADATMENGLLHIVIPFAEEAKPKTLEIK